uniref:Arf-GAP domain-containing protein n=1 Tax=Ananas comosus var. bracteatus TaxID=296719 RepID=A0A6V7P031_ANACO|nr:unnamed protein product [Ananas comosus var. bracteatus]
MANRVKEDEKNEKIIRGLVKLPANRRCINCNSLGPQYVCTNFSTFICINCSGIHREFTHRVKSISMAKFTPQEVSSLQEGGNERAREIYFKEWDPQRNSLPDSSNVDRLRDFIKHVYVDRRYTGERSIDRPPRVKGDREDSYQNNREDSYRGGSRSPPYDETYEHRYGDRTPNRSSSGNFEDRRVPDGIPKPAVKLQNNQKDVGAASPPTAQPVRDILAGVPPVRILEPPKTNSTPTTNSSAQAQTVPTSRSNSNQVNSAENNAFNSKSLIDFDPDPEPPQAGAMQSVPQQSNSSPAIEGGWASFDSASPQKPPQTATDSSTLESTLVQLSAPSSSAPAPNFSTMTANAVNSFPKANNGGQWPTLQQHQQLSLFPDSNGQANRPLLATPVVTTQNNQPWGASLAPSMQGSTAPPAGRAIQASINGPQVVPTVSSHPPASEYKNSGRKALPEDLFTVMYPTGPPSVAGWQTSQNFATMGYGFQYPAAAMMPPYAPSRSTNPFDMNEHKLAHSSTFPSLSSLQGALPNMNNTVPLSRAVSLGSLPAQWMPSQQSPYASAAAPSPYMLHPSASSLPQQAPATVFPMGNQAVGAFPNDRSALGFSSMDQNLAVRNAQSATPNSFAPVGATPNSFAPVGGNPFA